MAFKPINLLPDADQHKQNIDDTDYWMRMKESAVFKEYDIISSVAFLPKLPHHLATTTSNKAAVFDTSISQPVWLQSNFKSNVHGVKFRKDGSLMGMGSTDGFVRFFDIQQKNIPSRHALRVFQAHDCEVRTLAFASHHTCATFSDDGCIRLWDLSLSSATKPLWEVKSAHQDRIRAAASSAVSENLLVSGGYDHMVKVWDTRADSTKGPLVSVNHVHPVETLLFHENNRIIVTGGGNVVKFWDVSMNNKPLKVLENHARTVTSLCFATNGRFLLSGGLDRRIHAYRIDRGDFVLVNTLNTADSVLSLDIAPNDECMGFSMNNLLCIYRRHPKQHAFIEEKTNTILIGDGERIVKGKKSVVYHQERGAEAVKINITAKHVDQLHLGSFDNLLRQYKYRQIIDNAFAKKDPSKGRPNLSQDKPGVVVAVLDQIRLAGQLHSALAGRQGKSLIYIIRFLSNNLFHANYFDVLYDVATILLTIYAEEILNSAEVSALSGLKSQLNHELHCEHRLLHSLGTLNSLISSSLENNKKAEQNKPGDTVFGDLLIKPKLFSLKQGFSDSKLETSSMSLYHKPIEDNEEVPEEELSSEDEVDTGLSVRKRKRKSTNTGGFADEFQFDDYDESSAVDNFEGIKHYLKNTVASTLQEKIDEERSKQNIDKRVVLGGEIEKEENEPNDDLVQQFEGTSDTVREKAVKKGKKAKKDFFDPASSEISTTKKDSTFYEMELSRPILKAIMECGYSIPTAIQASCIPVALAGKDICACSATGTGKTAAFMLPILERLLYRPRKTRSVTRVLVLAPTRELAIQIFQVSRKLAQFSSVEICLCAGGLDSKAQEAALRLGLDIVIATPGRLIDHLNNAPNFSLLDVEVLVLDEADRMLEEQFSEQLKEIIGQCSKKRQTMLFSATMTDEVEDLAQFSLDKPVRLFINENTQTAANLRQEFIRIREDRESDRDAIVAALVTRNFPDHTIVFVRTKKYCERLHIMLGLLGVKVGQLHGGLTQSQRVKALSDFKSQAVDILLCTDLAARGLDIQGVMTVINMHMPNGYDFYVHRVGRTARAGKVGRSISLVGEEERKLFKEIFKKNKSNSLKIRSIASEVVSAYKERINSLGDSISRIENKEREEKGVRQAESVVQKLKKSTSYTAELTDTKRRSLKKFRYGPEDQDFKDAKKNMKKEGKIKGPRNRR